MKTIKKIQLLLFVILFSCSKNDDSPAVQGYFPTQIQKTDYGDPNRNRTYTISYNSQNQISQITETAVTGETATRTFTYSNNLVQSMHISSNATSIEKNHQYNYNTSNTLTSIIKTEGTELTTYSISYNSTSNSYSINEGGTISSLFLDNNNNPLEFELSPTNSYIISTDTSAKGVFENLNQQIGLQISFGIFESINFYHFHQKQINSIVFGTQNINVINTRDENGNIRTLNFNNPTTGQNIYGYIITYDKRPL